MYELQISIDEAMMIIGKLTLENLALSKKCKAYEDILITLQGVEQDGVRGSIPVVEQ